MQFADGQFVTSWVTGSMEVGDLVDVGRDVSDQLSFADLLMINIVDNLDAQDCRPRQ